MRSFRSTLRPSVPTANSLRRASTIALTQLDSIDGLDDIDITGMLSGDLDEADKFTSGAAIGIDEVSLDDLT